MKSLTFCLVLLLAALATLHNVAGQEEVTTTLAPEINEETTTKDKPQDTTEVPTPVESAPVESTSEAAKVEPTESQPESTVTVVEEEKPKEDENKDEPAPEDKTTESKDEPKEESKDESVSGDSERQPKESGEPQEPPKFIFVTQHIRDPVTGVVYSRQVPLIPTNYLRPNYQPGAPRPPMPPMPTQPERPQEASPPSFDPLGQYSETQKKRQFYQDMLMTQLSRFEKEIEPLAEGESNLTNKNDLEELLGTVAELKHKLESHQIFNISEIMNNWKQGKLGEGQIEPNYAQNEPHPQMPPQGYGRPRPSGPPVTLRTLILVPQNRVSQQPQQPQYQPYQPQMSQRIPVLHIRRVPAMYDGEGHPQQQPGRQVHEHMEPQPAGSEEYGNNNEIFY